MLNNSQHTVWGLVENIFLLLLRDITFLTREFKEIRLKQFQSYVMCDIYTVYWVFLSRYNYISKLLQERKTYKTVLV